MLTIEMMLKSGYKNPYKTEWNYQKVIKANANKVFIYDYPINPTFKEDFEMKVLAHFYKRNIIGVPGEFCYYLSEKLNILFPSFNHVLENIGNYDELFGNGDETITRIKSNTGSGTNILKRNLTGQGNNTSNVDDTTNINSNSTQENVNRDFPTGSVTDITKYMTDSQDGKTNANSTNTRKNIEKNNNNYSENGEDNTQKNFTEDEKETITRVDNSNRDKLDYFIAFRNEIDKAYEYIFIQLDELFYFVL